MPSNVKYSEDVIPLTDFKLHPGSVVRQVAKNRRPVLLTNRGRGVAVVQSLQEFEEKTEEHEFLRAVVRGLMDIEEGREIGLDEVKKRLGAV